MSALKFVIYALFRLFLPAFLMRVLLPLVRADARNPVSRFVIQITNPLVLPLRKLLPPIGRVDTPALIVLLAVDVACVGTMWWLNNLPMGAYQAILVNAAIDLLIFVLEFYFFAILLYALLSWVAQDVHSPVGGILNSLLRPILEPFRRLIPPISGFDLSAAFAAIAIKALEIFLVGVLGRYVVSWNQF